MSLTIQNDLELLFIGIVYSGLAVIVLPLYALIFYALNSRKVLRENISYRLINLLCVCDVSQLVCHVLSGLFIIFPAISEKIDVFVRITGCTANTLWLASFPILAILSSTRIGIAFFKLSATKWSLWMKISLATSGAYIFFIWIAGCVTQNFMMNPPAWSYDTEAPYSELFSQLEMVLCFPILAWNFCSYILIIYDIHSMKRKSQSASSIRVEIGILIQASTLTAYMALLITLWHNAEAWLTMSNITLAALNSAWICFSHLNSGLLIATNREIRSQIRKMICKAPSLSKSTSRVVPTITNHSLQLSN